MPPALPDMDAEARQAADLYSWRVPSVWAKRIDWHNPNDPLRRQVMPSAAELQSVAGFTVDPLAEHGEQRVPGLLQKYAGRVLLQVSGHCPIHCRYCFRRHDTYANLPHDRATWAPALQWIAQDPSIHEVVLSGGDPLMVADRHLAELVQSLAAIPHLLRLRVHSRMPVVAPKRVGVRLLRGLTTTRLTPVLVIHCNHAAELDAAVLAGLARLQQAGILVLNQSVLLRGVNDDADTLVALCETLVNHRVLPYYLHLLDPVAGAAHFQVDRERARALILELQARLPGYAVPKLVWEQPGQSSKVAVDLGKTLA
ncbi:MAG: EF-P beta-lysylation protein EpmB [Magnetococcales bacterium]|nr:EF-P beta-lysylation protein EpmB [Magnetococcales bacterium]